MPKKKRRSSRRRSPLVSSGIVCYAGNLCASIPWANRYILVSSEIFELLVELFWSLQVVKEKQGTTIGNIWKKIEKTYLVKKSRILPKSPKRVPSSSLNVFFSKPETSNQSRMCGKGVGLGLFPSEVEKWPFLTIFGLILTMLLTSQPYDFDAIAHIGL